jgi:hypothetical protein
MQDVHMKINPELPWQKQLSNGRIITSKLDLNFKEENSNVLNLECSFVWC